MSRQSVLARCDAFLCWSVVVGGVAQWALTPVFFPIIHEPAAWWFNGGITLVILGGINLLRIQHGAEVASLWRFAIAANVLVGLFYAAMLIGLWYKFIRYPFAFIGPVALFALVAMSLRSPMRHGAPILR